MSEEKKNKVYYREEQGQKQKLKIFLKKEGYPDAKFQLVNNSDGKGIFITQFCCGSCEFCKKGETCEVADDPPTQEELDANVNLFTKTEIEKQIKEDDPFLKLLKKHLKPEAFL